MPDWAYEYGLYLCCGGLTLLGLLVWAIIAGAAEGTFTVPDWDDDLGEF